MALIGHLFHFLFTFLFTSIGINDLILFFTSSILVYTCYFYFRYFTRKNPLPGPLPLPLVGNIIDRNFDNFAEYADQLRKEYGDAVEIYFGPRKFILLSKYEDILPMFDYAQDSKYLRRVSHIPGLDELDVSGKGVALNHDVEVWKYNRYFLSRAFITPNFSKYAASCVQNFVNEMIEFWTDSLNEDGYFVTDIVEWSYRFTTDSISYFTTGSKINCVEAYHKDLLALQNKKPKNISNNNTEGASEFFRAIKRFFISINYFIVIPPWIRNYIPFLRNITQSHLKNRDWLFARIDNLVKRRRKEIEHTPLGQELRADMLTYMITANTDRDTFEVKHENEHNEPMTDEKIRALLWETFIGGLDTTAISLTFIIHHLANYPEVHKRLRAELDDFFNKLGDRPLDIDNISDLVYTEAVIKEVIRIYTPSPFTARNSTAEDFIAGYVWPAETQYIINIHGMSNREEYWDEPEKFNPDRWLNTANSEKLNPYVSFGGGRRVCPGRKLSQITLKCLIALIYHKLDVELVDPSIPLKTKCNLVRSFDNLYIRVKPRKVQ